MKVNLFLSHLVIVSQIGISSGDSGLIVCVRVCTVGLRFMEHNNVMS